MKELKGIIILNNPVSLVPRFPSLKGNLKLHTVQSIPIKFLDGSHVTKH